MARSPCRGDLRISGFRDFEISETSESRFRRVIFITLFASLVRNVCSKYYPLLTALVNVKLTDTRPSVVEISGFRDFGELNIFMALFASFSPQCS
jgi:hypothetical protein